MISPFFLDVLQGLLHEEVSSLAELIRHLIVGLVVLVRDDGFLGHFSLRGLRALLDMEVSVKPVRVGSPLRHLVDGVRQVLEQVISRCYRHRVAGDVPFEPHAKNECGPVDRFSDLKALMDEPAALDHPPEPNQQGPIPH